MCSEGTKVAGMQKPQRLGNFATIINSHPLTRSCITFPIPIYVPELYHDMVYILTRLFLVLSVARLETFSHSQVSSTPLVGEVTLTNFSLTVTVSTCTSISYRSV